MDLFKISNQNKPRKSKKEEIQQESQSPSFCKSKMSMCFGCGSKFGFFKREHACKLCGRVYCNKCLSYKVMLPASQGDQEVCKKCHDSLKKNESTSRTASKASSGSYGQQIGQLPDAPPPYCEETNEPETLKQATVAKLDPDAEIRERLNNLKERDKKGVATNTDESIHERFSQLTGRQASSAQKSNILTPQPKLSEQEEINRLMEAAMAEAKLDENDTEAETGTTLSHENLEDRLLKLKDIDPDVVRKQKQQEELDSSEDETEATAKVLRKALAEARLDEKVTADGYGNLVTKNQSLDVKDELGLPAVPTNPISSSKPVFKPVVEEDDEELPWCCICNADATLRCHGCDDDLYCKRCYREGHSRFDMSDHQTTPFRQKRKK